MIIDIATLINGMTDEIIIDNTISFDKNYLDNSDILELNNVKVLGKVIFDEEDELYIDITASGEMILEDSISLDEISYPFSVRIEEKVDENSKKISNTIDIMDILWQNIVLEVPLQLTEVNDLTKYQGEGWKLVSEEELNKENNPFSNLKDMLGEE